MNMTAEMMKSMSMELAGVEGMPASMDMMAMQDCIEACAAAEQACTICADSSMGEGMAKCASMCMNGADMNNTTMRMMMRPMGVDMKSMTAVLEACAAMSMACADECMKHAGTSETCRMCAQACRAAAEACESMMMAMKSAS
ncbi:MAG: hypothetical protein QOD05_1746 [Microbacteriaceae bacterium]|jgi:hypothetical protein|nr:hypothetical protein [Leifsonia sp.]MDQ1580971.1 hypothetical protein [Microbacteriaceae bacterium]MDQ1588463.1 hypothetical protein [Microbacteriaceae bacterium]